jgi:hypothetical protein
MICKICNSDIHLRGIGKHLTTLHKLTSEEYYVKYVNSVIPVCPCGKNGKFRSLTRGYDDYCCRKHYWLTDKSVQAGIKISNSFKIRDMDTVMIKRKATNIKKYGVEHVTQVEGFSERAIAAQLERYGEVRNFSNSRQRKTAEDAIKNDFDRILAMKKISYYENDEKKALALQKREETCEELYGVKNVRSCPDVKKRMREYFESIGRWIPEEEYSEYKKYSLSVKRMTNVHYDELYSKWNGYDYYTGEYIKEETGLLKPSVDHKISRYYGYKNNISAEEISSYDNLCICSSKTNSTKNRYCENEYKQRLENERTNSVETKH